MSGFKLKLYSIFYDEETAKSIPSGMIPLENTDGPAWLFEAHPIYHYFTQNQVNDDEWIGFFSPKFKSKTDLTAADITKMFDEKCDNFDVCLFTSHFDQAVDDARLIFIINANAMDFMMIAHDCAVRWLATAGDNLPAGITKGKRGIKSNTA